MARRCNHFLLVFATVYMTGCAAQQSGDPAATRSEVLAANDQYSAALNAMFTGDVAPMDAIWSHADDVAYLPPSGERLQGWDAVGASWKRQADLKLGGAIEAQGIQVVVLSPSTALLTSSEVGNNPDGPGGPMDVNIRATKVYRREDGRWRVIYLHADPLAGLVAAAN